MSISLYLSELWRGKDLYRIFMNQECARHAIRGRVLDIGSGLRRASYHRFLKREPSAIVESLDLGFAPETGQTIDLEKDFLPRAGASVDAVLLFNVLEHLYNYALTLSEIKRVMKPGGQLLGVVPFLVAYHPDPHDYWRYTVETLPKILADAGFSNIEIRPFGYGPSVAAFSQAETALPRLVKILLLPFVLAADAIIVKLRPRLGKDKFSLGLFFKATNE